MLPLKPEERAKLFHSILGMGKGLDVLDEIMRLCGADIDTFDRDPYVNAHNAGLKAAAYKIKGLVFREEKRKELEAIEKDTESKTTN